MPPSDLSEIRDLRDWLAVAEELDQVQHVEGAHWNLEIGTLSHINYRRGAPRALLFDHIPDYPAGYRVLTGSMANALRLGLTLRLGVDLDDQRILSDLRGKPALWEDTAEKFAPVVVDDLPVLEHVVEGDDIDLSAFPAPFWNEHDGGRFLGTGCAAFTSDPVTGLVNAGANRVQIQEDGRTCTVNAVPGKHNAQNIDAWFARYGRAPMTLSFGHDPLLLVCAGTDVPQSISELNYAGAIRGAPIEIGRGEVNGLPIPARSEIVVEGWLYPDYAYPEGPFGEWTGYYSGSEHPVLAMRIDRVCHRENPIILGAPPGKPPHDYSYMRSAVRSSMILDELVKSGLAGVKDVWAHEAGGGRLLITVAIEQKFFGHARQAAYLAAQGAASAYMNRYTVVVDDDIDPRNLDEVIWAICTRSDPGIDIEVMRRTYGSKADPLSTDQAAPYNSRAIIDACWPYERRKSFPQVAVPSPDLRRRTEQKWAALFAGTDTEPKEPV